jgi:hypothetical protein
MELSATEQHRLNIEEQIAARAAIQALRIQRQQNTTTNHSSTDTPATAMPPLPPPAVPPAVAEPATPSPTIAADVATAGISATAADATPAAGPNAAASVTIPPAAALNTPAAAIAGASAAAASAAATGGNFDTDYGFEDNAPEFDWAAANYEFKQRVIHFLRGHSITATSRQCVEICILIEIGTIITGDKQIRVNERESMMLQKYREHLDFFDPSDFVPASLKFVMKDKLFAAKGKLDGARLWAAYGKWKSVLRSEFFTKLPSNIARIPSGNQLKDVWDKFLLAKFKEGTVSYTCIISVTVQ